MWAFYIQQICLRLHDTCMSCAALLDILITGYKEIQIWKWLARIHTVGPANREVPESAIAEQPLAQNPGK